MLKPRSLAILIGLLVVPVLSSCSGGGGSAEVPESARQKSLSDFQYSKEDVQYGEKGSDSEGMIVGGRRSQFEGKKQVAFGGDLDKRAYSANRYKAQKWDGGKNYKTNRYGGNTDASRYQTQSRYGAQGAREASRQSGYSGQGVDTPAYATAGAREGDVSQLASPGSRESTQRYGSQPRIIPYRDYQRMTIEETNSILGRE